MRSGFIWLSALIAFGACDMPDAGDIPAPTALGSGKQADGGPIETAQQPLICSPPYDVGVSWGYGHEVCGGAMPSTSMRIYSKWGDCMQIDCAAGAGSAWVGHLSSYLLNPDAVWATWDDNVQFTRLGSNVEVAVFGTGHCTGGTNYPVWGPAWVQWDQDGGSGLVANISSFRCWRRW